MSRTATVFQPAGEIPSSMPGGVSAQIFEYEATKSAVSAAALVGAFSKVLAAAGPVLEEISTNIGSNHGLTAAAA